MIRVPFNQMYEFLELLKKDNDPDTNSVIDEISRTVSLYEHVLYFSQKEEEEKENEEK